MPFCFQTTRGYWWDAARAFVRPKAGLGDAHTRQRTRLLAVDRRASSQSFTLDTWGKPSILEDIMTAKRMIYITAADMTRLRSLVTDQKNSREDLKILNAELDRAQVVAPAEIPRDVITKNSKAHLRELLTDDVMTYTLVFPDLADYDARRISVLALIGTAMLGQREIRVV